MKPRESRASGRWGGKLTSRPLPDDDDTLAALSDDDRRTLVEVWLGRSATERRVGDAFAVIRDTLVELRATPELLAMAARAVDDEHRHAELCRYVASRVQGSELEPPPPLALEIPVHPGAGEELTRTLHVVGMCALNETMASAFLETCLRGAKAPLAHAASRELLSDEIDHSRIGWAHLATTSEAIRKGVGRWILPLTRGQLRLWRASARGYASSDTLTEQGAPPRERIDEALVGSVRELIIPGLDRLGVGTRVLTEWLEAGAVTRPL
jgi:hypothetical protein